MEVGAVVAAAAAAFGSLGSMAARYQRGSSRVRAEIDANNELACKFADGSPERTALEAYGQLLIDDYIRRGVEKIGNPRRWTWGTVITTGIAGAGFGYGALLVEAQWAKFILWVMAGLMAISIFGQITPPRSRAQKDDSRQVASRDQQEGSTSAN